MNYKEYTKKRDELLGQIEKLKKEYIKKHREFKDGEIVLRLNKRVVIDHAYDVSNPTEGKVMYKVTPINKDGSLAAQQITIYGHEGAVSTGEFWDYGDDLL